MQGIGPLLDPAVFYTFQGLTGVFPLEAQQIVEGQLPQTMTAEQLAALQAQSADRFQPALVISIEAE